MIKTTYCDSDDVCIWENDIIKIHERGVYGEQTFVYRVAWDSFKGALMLLPPKGRLKDLDTESDYFGSLSSMDEYEKEYTTIEVVTLTEKQFQSFKNGQWVTQTKTSPKKMGVPPNF